jgi:hypothetical protein
MEEKLSNSGSNGNLNGAPRLLEKTDYSEKNDLSVKMGPSQPNSFKPDLKKEYLESEEEIDNYINFYIKSVKDISHLYRGVRRQMFEGVAKKRNSLIIINHPPSPSMITFEIFEYTLALLNLNPLKGINNYNDLDSCKFRRDGIYLGELHQAIIHNSFKKADLFSIIINMKILQKNYSNRYRYSSNFACKIESCETLEELIQVKYDIESEYFEDNYGHRCMCEYFTNKIVNRATKLLS